MFSSNSILFVPGSRPERFAKAQAGGAGTTVIDLEDAVPSAEKASAREAALAEVAGDGAGWAIRINPVTTDTGAADLTALESANGLPEFLFLPMVQAASEIETVVQALGDRCPGLVPLVETPRALRHALAIAEGPKVEAVMFGGGDFASELGVKLEWDPLQTARQLLILACAEAGVPAIDVPYIHLDDEAGLAKECARARAIGFAAKAAIHPRQVAAIEHAFTPSASEVNEAAEALRAFDEAGGKVISFKGRMLEAPIVKHYRAIIARSEESSHA